MHLSEKIVCSPFCWKLKLGMISIILHELSTTRMAARKSFHELYLNMRHEERFMRLGLFVNKRF